ncbi:MAG: TIGR03067 domain-containing protein [Planctomycetaceae bacterium]|nr:TIGR03067 domain-containing protein [Planctomycetaceae bacterium]
MLANPYGPWATSLGSCEPARLSTFWRQRLQLLPSANRSASRGAWRAVAICGALALAVPGLRISPAQDDRQPHTDPDLEGSWQLIFGRDGGNQIEKLRLTFHGDRVTIVDRNSTVQVKYRVDASKSPQQIDLNTPDENSAPTPPDEVLGIYQVRDDHLVLCLNEDEGGERPTEFRAEPVSEGRDLVLLVMAREDEVGSSAAGAAQTPLQASPPKDSSPPPPSAPQDSNPAKPTEKSQNDRRNPWSVFGRVTDAEGRPVEGVKVRAATGYGTLRTAGAATTDSKGEYEFRFGSSFFLVEPTEPYCVAASIFASKPGFSEKNLCRQGGCVAAVSSQPEEEIDLAKVNTWGQPAERVFLPGVAKEINFVLAPAGRVAGRVLGADAKPLVNYSVCLTGKDLPPSSSVLAQVRTDAAGQFSIENIPTGYAFQFLIEPPKREQPWFAWASGLMHFDDPGQGELSAFTVNGAGRSQFMADKFELLLVGEGDDWKSALQKGSDSTEWRYLTENAEEAPSENSKTLKCERLQITLGRYDRAANRPARVSEDQISR